MKILSLVLCLFVCSPAFSHSQALDPIEEAELENLMFDHEWLYELLMPDNYKSKDWEERARKSFRVHLRDTVNEFPHPDNLKTLQVPSDKDQFEITGKITYVGFVKKSYRHEILRLKDGTFQFEVRVHFKNANAEDLRKIASRFTSAERMWNEARYDFGVPYQFRFRIVNNSKDSHFSVRLVKGTRGPYDVAWNPSWSAYTVAHELGHMLGLGDEYKTLSGKIDCISRSLMCAGSLHMPFHHYHILRRLFLEDAIKDSVIKK